MPPIIIKNWNSKIDRSVLIGQNMVENVIEKFKWDICGDFQTLWLAHIIPKVRATEVDFLSGESFLAQSQIV